MGGAASFAAGPGSIVPGPERAMALEWIPQQGKQLSLLIVCALLPIMAIPAEIVYFLCPSRYYQCSADRPSRPGFSYFVLGNIGGFILSHGHSGLCLPWAEGVFQSEIHFVGQEMAQNTLL